ncbi:MAG: hypothetical protein JSV65_18710 [Armatimonadota bacterium]|nr:MAG: hypothetical protein JSV65_18710 [Armatimonadota bacterium]
MTGSRPLDVGVVWDESAREQANRSGRNYWYAYIWDMLERLGIAAARVPPSALATPKRLARLGSIILGGVAEAVPGEAAAALTEWVRAGGTLIGFAVEGLDGLFGIRPRAAVPQPEDEFAITGYLEFTRGTLTHGIHSPLAPEQRLIIISPVRPVVPVKGREVARFFAPHAAAPDDGARARATRLAIVTARRVGKGWAFYFGFDVPHTIWALQQGRPIDRDYDGDGYLRFGDAMVIGSNSPHVPYADELALLVQNMLARRPTPMLHQLPPTDGAVPDALFHFGGDDECQPGVHLPASDFMRSRGLPYHINLMPLDGRFAISRQEFRRIRANGHELSLHYNFMDGFTHPGPFAEQDVAAQVALYRAAFGRAPVCTVNHWCRWAGWAEPAKWMLAAGAKADNSRIHYGSPPLNPVNRMGFAFGTAFPYFFRDDWRGGNARIPFVQEPIVAYEVGYEGGATDFRMLRHAVDIAARYHMTMNMFYHPVYIASYPACRTAIDELLRYVRGRKLRAVFMGSDELWRWWWQRSRGRIGRARAGGDAVSFTARCGYSGGFVVKLPLGREKPTRCLVDGKPVRFHVERRFGRTWVLVPLPRGEHDVAVKFASR